MHMHSDRTPNADDEPAWVTWLFFATLMVITFLV